MEKIKGLINNELKNWSKFDYLWMIIANAVIIGVSLYFHDSAIGIDVYKRQIQDLSLEYK